MRARVVTGMVVVACLAQSAGAFRVPGFTLQPRQRSVALGAQPLMQLAPRPNSGWSKVEDRASPATGAMTLDVRRFALDHPAPSHSDLTGNARIFLDSGRIEDYARYLPLGMVWGVTTNPIILERAGHPCTYQSIKDLAMAAFSLGANEFMAQAWGGDVGSLVEHGLQIASIDPRVVVKVPVTAAGLEAATVLRAQGVRICTTAVYASHQVVSSVAVAAEYAAPYLGRMTEAGKDGMAQVAAMQSILGGMNSKTRLLVASVRSADQVGELAARGCTTFTLSAEVMQELVSDPLTLEATSKFEEAASGGAVTKSRSMGFSS